MTGGEKKVKAPAQSVAPSFIQGLYDKAVREQGIVDRGPIPYVVPTGSMLLDRATGIGGFPGGRVIEIYGPESSGKTTLALHACVNAQAMGKSFGILDLEAALDVSYFRKLGVQGDPNVDWLHISPETGEDAFTIMSDWIEGGVKVIVVDSVAAMTPKAELDGDMGEAFMGLQARMMGQGLRKVVNQASLKEVLIIFINQTRSKIGVVFGNPETTTGGKALAFWSSMRIRTEQVGDPLLDKDGEQIGRQTKIVMKKNKLSAPMKVCMVPVIWGRGLAPEIELLDILLIEGMVSKTSSYFVFPDGTKVNGKVAAYDYIGEHAAELLLALDVKRKG